MKTGIWKRLLSLLLVITLLAPTVLGALPEKAQLSVKANAASVDVGSLGVGQPGMLVSGIYEIYVPGTQLALGTNSSDNSNAPLYLMDSYDSAYNHKFMRWVIEYGGEWTDSDGTVTHWYTIRHLSSGRLVRQGGTDSGYFHKLVAGDTADPYSRWQLLYNAATGLYSIRNWGHCVHTAENWSDGYMVPVEKNASNWNGIEKDQDFSTGSNFIGALAEAFEYELKRVPVQRYGDAQLPYGTYRVTNGTYNLRANPNEGYQTEPQWPYPDSFDFATAYHSLAATGSEQSDGTQLFRVDWTADGYVTISDAAKGRYVGSRNNYMTSFGEAIAELVDNPGTSFDERIRFFWIPIPVYSGIDRQANQYYLCNALTGQRMYMNQSLNYGYGYIITGNKWVNEDGTTTYYSPTPFTFTAQTSADVKEENPTQGYNGSTGAYVDSFDHSDTIRLPIKIYDYENDGMLFEYAQSNSKGNPVYNSAGTSVLGYTGKQVIDGKTYIMGNNTVFTFQSGSRGGTGWVGNTNGYTNYQGTATNYYGESAWNTYRSFHLGRVWSVQGSTAKWYTTSSNPSDGNTFNGSNYDYNWESIGLGEFRFGTAMNYGKDIATIYYIAGNSNVAQGIFKDSTASISGTLSHVQYADVQWLCDWKSGFQLFDL